MSANVHDVTFRFDNSCNCFCKRRSPDPDTPIFVDAEGVVQRFNFSRTRDTMRSVELTHQRVRERLKETAHSIKAHPDHFVNLVANVAEVNLDEKSFLTYGTIRKINSAIPAAIAVNTGRVTDL